jgi:MFS transporter, SP family, galactose:H+ symporter
MSGQRLRRHGLLPGLTAASPGAVYGYDLSNIAGALSPASGRCPQFITEEFGLTTRQQELVTTAVVVGEIAGALGAGVLANLIGRRWSMMLVAAGYAVFALLGATSDSVTMLLVARLLLGLTIGVSVVVVPVFAAHSPAVFGFIGVLPFTMGFTFGLGALLWVYAGESFPSRLWSMGRARC